MGNNGTYYCNRCNRIEPVRRWKYKCHYHDGSYSECVSLLDGSAADVADVAESLATCIPLVQTTGLCWMNELLRKLESNN